MEKMIHDDNVYIWWWTTNCYGAQLFQNTGVMSLSGKLCLTTAIQQSMEILFFRSFHLLGWDSKIPRWAKWVVHWLAAYLWNHRSVAIHIYRPSNWLYNGVYVYICVCMYYYNYIYIYIFMYIYIYTYIHICIYIYIYIYTYIHIYIYIHIHIYICIHIYTYIYVYVYITIHLCICITIIYYIHMYAYVYIYTYICDNMYIYIY